MIRLETSELRHECKRMPLIHAVRTAHKAYEQALIEKADNRNVRTIERVRECGARYAEAVKAMDKFNGEEVYNESE